MTDRCPTCDRPDGWGPAALTPEWIAAHPNADGCECPMCVALCWDGPSGPQCRSGAVDWRERALAARELLLRALTVLPGDCRLETDIRAWLRGAE